MYSAIRFYQWEAHSRLGQTVYSEAQRWGIVIEGVRPFCQIYCTSWDACFQHQWKCYCLQLNRSLGIEQSQVDISQGKPSQCDFGKQALFLLQGQRENRPGVQHCWVPGQKIYCQEGPQAKLRKQNTARKKNSKLTQGQDLSISAQSLPLRKHRLQKLPSEWLL